MRGLESPTKPQCSSEHCGSSIVRFVNRRLNALDHVRYSLSQLGLKLLRYWIESRRVDWNEGDVDRRMNQSSDAEFVHGLRLKFQHFEENLRFVVFGLS